MADQSDIENSLVGLIAAVLFPTITYQPPTASPAAVPPWSVPTRTGSASGSLTRVYRGWPVPESLDSDLAAGIANVSVFPDQGMARNVTRYQQDWQQTATVTPTLTATVSGQQITIGGTAGAGQCVGIAIGEGRLVAGYVYRALATDTLHLVAAGLAALIPGATASGAALTAPGVIVGARVVADQPASQEVRRIEQRFRISFWCPTPQSRDALVSAVDASLAGTERFVSAGASVRLIYVNGYSVDDPRPDLWRRDICYHCEFPTTQTATQPTLLFPTLGIGVARNAAGLTGGADIVVQAGTASPIASILTDGAGNILTDSAGNLLAPIPT